MSDGKELPERQSIFYTILPVLLCGLSIPLSLFLWLGNLALTFLTKSLLDSEGKPKNRLLHQNKMKSHSSEINSEILNIDNEPIPPTRWLFSTLVPILLMVT